MQVRRILVRNFGAIYYAYGSSCRDDMYVGLPILKCLSSPIPQIGRGPQWGPLLLPQYKKGSYRSLVIIGKKSTVKLTSY